MCIMAFVPIVGGVYDEKEEEYIKFKKEGYKLMNHFFAANQENVIDPFLTLLLERIGPNIVNNPEEEKVTCVWFCFCFFSSRISICATVS